MGTRLVVIDETGDRQFDLFEAPDVTTRDTHPAVSPDGRWLVFASSRDRALEATSLWIAPLTPGATPTRLTDGLGVESHPVWTSDGSAIVFASTRDGGDFDLYAQAIANGRATAAPSQITSAAGHEVTPAVSRDGTIYYAAITEVGTAEIESHLEARGPDGTITRVTEGPADASPVLSPDERTLVFARPKEHRAGLDGELWTMPRDGGEAVQLIDLPLTDESGPVWSRDSRFLFATSVLRGAAGNAMFSSVIVIDMNAHRRVARMLIDRVGANPRLTPALTLTSLDASALAVDPEYLPELARIMSSAIAKHKQQQPP